MTTDPQLESTATQSTDASRYTVPRSIEIRETLARLAEGDSNDDEIGTLADIVGELLPLLEARENPTHLDDPSTDTPEQTALRTMWADAVRPNHAPLGIGHVLAKDHVADECSACVGEVLALTNLYARRRRETFELVVTGFGSQHDATGAREWAHGTLQAYCVAFGVDPETAHEDVMAALTARAEAGAES